MFLGKKLLFQWMLFDWEKFFESIAKNCVALLEGDKFINAETKNIAFMSFLIFKMLNKLKEKINLEDFLSLFY
jgi:hypothetical protein